MKLIHPSSIKPRLAIGLNSRACLKAFVIALSLITYSAIPARLVRAQTTGPTYVVQAGDTLSAIALRFGTTIDELVEVNNIVDPSLVYSGSVLIIPSYEGLSGELVTRKVDLGESLSSLSLRYGVPIEALIRLNRIVNPDRIYSGQSFVVINEGQNPITVPSSTSLMVPPSSGMLEISARSGENPWLLSTINHLASLAWVTPGDLVRVPGSSQTTSALPDFIDTIDVRPNPLVQGRTTRVLISLEQPAIVRGNIGDHRLNFFAIGEKDWVALQGINALAEPGLLDFSIDILSADDSHLVFGLSQQVLLEEGGYGYDPVLKVPEETLDPSYTRPEDELLDDLFGKVSLERYWEGLFHFPSTIIEAFPSYFGARRNYNNIGYYFYHTGLDFYGGTGDPIYAPARGKVVFADSLKVRGKTTVIDHGWGIFSAYFHQSEILVQVGDVVEIGEVIGLVGGTGRATGPHLHWELRVGGVPVDPIEWTQVPFP